MISTSRQVSKNLGIRATGVGIMPGWHGMEERPKPHRNGEKMENQMENNLQVDRGRKWPSKIHYFLDIFCPCPLGDCFPFGFPYFFPISGFWPFSISCQPDMIPKLGN